MATALDKSAARSAVREMLKHRLRAWDACRDAEIALDVELDSQCHEVDYLLSTCDTPEDVDVLTSESIDRLINDMKC